MEKICGSIIINSVRMYKDDNTYYVSINGNINAKSKNQTLAYLRYLKVLKLQSQQVIRQRGNVHHKTNRYISYHKIKK